MSTRHITQHSIQCSSQSYLSKTTARKSQQGWSLIEILTTLTIIALLSSLSLPNFNSWFQQRTQSALFRSLYHLTYFSRSQAISLQTYVTLCPTNDHVNCSHNWDDTSVMVFSDSNKNEQLDAPEDQLLRVMSLPQNKPCLALRASGGKQYLQFKATGASNGIAGHFRFCDPVHNHIAKKLVISLNGRPTIQDL